MGIFKKIAKLFKSLLKAIKKILAVILIVIAVILFVWATICTAGATLAIAGFLITPTTAALLGIVAVTGAFLVDKDTAQEVTGKIGDALGSVAETVGSTTGKVVGGGVKGLLSSPAVWLVGGFGLLWMLSSSDEPRAVEAREPVEQKKKTTSDKRVMSTGPAKAKDLQKPARPNDMEALLMGA